MFAVFLAVAVTTQISVKRFYSALYWLTIIATTTVGITMTDFADRSLGIGYAGGSAMLLILLLKALLVWRRTMGSVSVRTVSTPKAEIFYWVTIMFSQTLGTALGDWTAHTADLGYRGGAMLFSILLALIFVVYDNSSVSRTLLFWTAFVLTRPLGAVVGDLLDRPHSSGGFELSRYVASAVLFAFIALSLVVFPQKASTRVH